MSSETISHGHTAAASVHSHDSHEAHGHDHHHEESFLSKYVFSTDHKMIGKQFLITGIIWAIIGGLFSVLFRLQLGYPEASFPVLEDLFGKWAAGGRISNQFYYALVTMHGTILVFFVLTAGLSGTFANILIPLQIGARDMASGFLNMLSYWFFFLASVVMFASLFIQTGPASGGWTVYPPLSALGQASEGSKLGMDFWLISMALFIVSSLLGGLNYISTILNLRTKGMSMTRMPLTMWAIFFTAVLGVLSFPVLLSGAVLLLFDRNLGTSFFLSEIVVKGEILPNEGGSAILFQHLFWFLGHPEVYIILLPALGMVSEILSVNSRKPIFGYLAMVGSLFAICILAFLVWAHHMFVTGLNPFLGAFFVLLTLLIAVPSAIKVFNWLTTLWKGNIRFTPGMLFSIGFISLFISGGLTGIFLGNSTLDIHLHDTYFVVAHFHIVMGVASFFWNVCWGISLVPEDVWPFPEQYHGVYPFLGNPGWLIFDFLAHALCWFGWYAPPLHGLEQLAILQPVSGHEPFYQHCCHDRICCSNPFCFQLLLFHFQRKKSNINQSMGCQYPGVDNPHQSWSWKLAW